MTNPTQRMMAILASASTFLAICSLGCGSSTTPSGQTSGTQNQSQNAGTAFYSVRIQSEIPAGATQLRISGADEEGDVVQSNTVTAERIVTVSLTADVSTLALEYLDKEGNLLATFVESAQNLESEKFPAQIINPPLVILPRTTVQARAGDDVITPGQTLPGNNPVVGDNIKFSFAFVGCNRARPPADNRPNFANQLNQEEKDATANVAQLRQHFEDIKSLNPRPKFVFLCGDVVQKPRTDTLADAPGIVKEELRNWKKIRATGPVLVDKNGVTTNVTAPAAGSLFPSDVTVVVMPGNHEMCYRTVDDSQELPNEGSGAAFVSEMAPYILNNNGPEKQKKYGAGSLNLIEGTVQRDETQLSYTFRAAADGTVSPSGEYLFMVLNTDTYTGAGAPNVGRIPLGWIRKQLYDAQKDASVKHIFVFGHRPVEKIQTEFGINPTNDEANNFDRLLNHPDAENSAQLQTASNSTKVRGYFCAHAHLMSTKQPRGGPVQQLVAGSGGSEPETLNGKYYPWFGFGVVGVGKQESVDAAFFGRNVHPSKNTTLANSPGTHWDEQEPLKLRGANISGPGNAPAKIPKAVRRLYPF